MNVEQLSHPISLGQKPLPIQVGYIVPTDAPADLLDAVFADCYTRWGGRDTLLLPAQNGTINERYWTWARAIDPDVVYSYVPYDDALLGRIDRDLMPSAVEQHRDASDWRPRFREAHEPLQALSLLPYLASNRSWGHQGRLALLTAYMSTPPDPFITDSFGIAPFGPGWAQANDVQQYADTLALGDRANDQLRSIASEDIADATAVLERLPAWNPETLTMAQISALGYDAHRHRLEAAWDTFNIIIGDTTPDRIAFWNARVGAEPYLRGRIIALRIPEARLNDQAFLDAVVEFVGRTNHPRFGNGPAYAAIRSASITADRLNMLVEPLHRRNVHARVETITDLAACAATSETRWAAAPDLDTQRYTESPIALRPLQPAHLKLWPVQRPMITGGAWAVRATLYRDTAQYSGRDGAVKIPRRWQAIHAITTDGVPKASLTGALRFTATNDTKPLRVSLIPDDEQFVRSLFAPYHYLTTTEPRNTLLRVLPQTYTVISSAGRQLLGFLSKIGSLGEAFAIIDDTFWQAVFAVLAGPLGSAPDDQIVDVARIIKKRLKGKDEFKSDSDWQLLAEELVRLAARVKVPGTRQPFSWFLERYRQHGSEAQRWVSEPDGAAHLVAFVSDRLTRLCSSAVFHQGYAWMCEHCNHQNFVAVDRLASHLQCNVCQAPHALAANTEFQFLLDEAIVRGMRERGLRTVVWALGFLQASAEHAFLFAPPLDLYVDRKHFTDVDIPCAVDGRVVIGEAKDSVRHITQATSDKLIEAARVVRPDLVVLACLDPTAVAAVDAQVAYIRATLNDPRIDVRGLTTALTQPGVPTSIIARGFWRSYPQPVLPPPQNPPPPAASPPPWDARGEKRPS